MKSINNIYQPVEDDALRSEYVWRLLQDTSTELSLSDKRIIPKVIVQFWHNLNELPKDVQNCIDSWKALDRLGFSRLLFDEVTARQFILDNFNTEHVAAFDKCHHPAMKCDYFRLCFILLNGGFYVDADEVYQGKTITHLFEDNTLKIQPLCYDCVTDKMVKFDVDFQNKKYSPKRIYYFNNNPLIAPANHPIIHIALERATMLISTQPKTLLDIQSTTGPGNLTSSVVRHSIDCKLNGNQFDFQVLYHWDELAISAWPLSYRNDVRNWRLWDASQQKRW